ncbi:hypothetical protein, partial [Treponema sp. R6D11]
SEERGLILFGGGSGCISPQIKGYWAKIEKQVKEDLKEQISGHENKKNIRLDSRKKENSSLLNFLMPFKSFKRKTE